MWHQGKAWFFGGDVDTDQIMPARYLALKTAEDLSKHALEAVDPSWPTTIKPGDVLFAGVNFGCGSSREHAALGLKGLGVGCVVAKSFARIFYRNSINIGLPLLVLHDDIRDQQQGRPAWVDIATGRIKFAEEGLALQGVAPAQIVQDILAHGGLMAYTAARAKQRGQKEGMPAA
jgi:3-isopropylmalate/(R)-2-methylmalate dehydratase small subunit